MTFSEFGSNQIPGMTMPYEHMVSRGVVRGASIITASGKSIETGAVSKVLWSNGVFSIPPAGGIRMEVKSTSTEDGVGGDGIRSIEFHYLDGDLNPQHEILTLDGTDLVFTEATDISFVQIIHVADAGVTRKAVGNISMQEVGGGPNYGYISIGSVRDASSARMVPAGKRLMVYGAMAGTASETAAASVVVEMASTFMEGHSHIDPFILIPFAGLAFQDNSFGLNFPFPVPFPSGEVVALIYDADKAATVSGNWFGLLEEEE